MYELLNNSEVKIAEVTKKVLINGKIQNLQVYRIPLNLLYYNGQNDRIATCISKYESENGNINNNSKEDYNKIIENFIIGSNKLAFDKTKNNIKLFEQQEAGVVLNDGNIIDGNRRYTCLRKLYEECNDTRYYYFEAVILPANTSKKEIKRLELSLQHGKDEKVDYDPIEKLVGVYRDIIKNKTLTAEEYACSIDENTAFVEKLVDRANLMIEFLEHINAKEQFYIARDLDIDGPIIEVANIKKRITNEDEWEQVKMTLFDLILQKPEGDITRMIRDIGAKILSSSRKEEYLEEHLAVAEKIQDKLNKVPVITTEYIRNEIRNDDSLTEELVDLNDKVKREIQYEQIKNLPVKQLTQCLDIVESIDIDTVAKMNEKQKIELNTCLERIKIIIKEIEQNLNI
ncbi:MAG: hypothetical protein RR623_03485 [Bacilli bacterium]